MIGWSDPSGIAVEEAVRSCAQVAEVPGFNLLVAIGLAPGIENLLQPRSTSAGCHSGIAGRRINLGAHAGPPSAAAIAIRRRYGLSGSSLPLMASPQGSERHEHGLAPLRFIDLVKQAQRGLPIDLSTLKLEVVGILGEADQQRAMQRGIVLAVVLVILIVVLIRILGTGVLALSSGLNGAVTVSEKSRELGTHGSDSLRVVLRKAMAGS